MTGDDWFILSLGAVAALAFAVERLKLHFDPVRREMRHRRARGFPVIQKRRP